MVTLPTPLDLSKLATLADEYGPTATAAKERDDQASSPQGLMRFRRSFSDLEAMARASKPTAVPGASRTQSRRQRRSLGDVNMVKFSPPAQEDARVFRRIAAKLGQARNDSSNSARDQRYAEMMERFQIRRVSTQVNAHSMRTSRSPRTARSTKVHPGLPDHSDATRWTENSKYGRYADTAGYSRTQSISSFGPGLQHQPGPSVQVFEETSLAGVEDVPAYSLSLRDRITMMKRSVVTPFHPKARVARIRSIMLLFVFAVHAIYFPIEAAFFDLQAPTICRRMDWIFEVIMLCDSLVSFNSAFIDKRGRVVTNRFLIAQKYARGWLVPDLLSAVPIAWVLLKVPNPSLYILVDFLLRLPRFLHVMEISREAWLSGLHESDQSGFAKLLYSRFSHLVRIASVIFYIVLGAHFTACMLKILTIDEMIPAATNPLSEYVSKVYDALQLLQGQGVPTKSTGQTLFASFSLLLGSIMLAIVFGDVAILVSNFNANSTSYQRKMEFVFATMSKLQLPTPLRERIHQYYEHLWREYESLDGEIVAFSKGLSHTLEFEVVLFKYMDLIMHVPFWRDGSPDFQKQLMLSLHVRVYLPDDFIIRRGEVGDEFFMINRGICELILSANSFECSTDPLDLDGDEAPEEITYNPTDTRVETARKDVYGKRRAPLTGRRDVASGDAALETTQILRRGQSFGELALLMNYERTANVRALTYVEMCVLKRRDVQEIFVKHPKDRFDVINSILTRSLEHNDRKKVFCPLRQAVVAVFNQPSDSDLSSEQSQSQSISPAHAALLITTAIDNDVGDTSITFGIGPTLKHKLVNLKASDGEPKDADVLSRPSVSTITTRSSHSPELIPPARETHHAINHLVNRLDQLRTSQHDLLAAMKALNQDLKETRAAFAGCSHCHH